MKLIVGLGNPGTEYAGTRHNVGFDVVEYLAKRHGIAISKRNFKGVYGEGFIGTEKVLLLRPMTYMNLSGQAVSAICHFYKIATQDVLVILDDVAMDTGRLRLRYKGSAGGHNGLANIIQLMGTDEIPRVRVGVGASRQGDMVNHVLGKFRKEEKEEIEVAYQLASDAIEYAVREGFEKAMNRYNISSKPTKETPVP
ncbi:MAG: aminoacyl-tRNA hydrolase [Armatimonadetes bacterium]|nr:aminoacyl-tRNA hydrolase [Armatimonadota bacterium]